MRGGWRGLLRWSVLLALLPLALAAAPHFHDDGEVEDGRCVLCQANEGPAVMDADPQPPLAAVRHASFAGEAAPHGDACLEGLSARGPPIRA